MIYWFAALYHKMIFTCSSWPVRKCQKLKLRELARYKRRKNRGESENDSG